MIRERMKHDVIHLTGCYGLALTFLVLGVDYWVALGMAAALGMAWEVLDAINQTKGWKLWFLDPSGGDIVDLVADLAGVALAAFIFIL